MAKILLADDDTELALAVKDWLTDENHSVDVLDSGDEALERLRHYQYDLAIIDWKMPGLSGVEVCKRYRDTGGTVPLLILTGKTDVAEKEQGLDAGADDYLTKPFEMRELSARVRALARRRAGTEANISNVLEVGELSLDRQKLKVLLGGEEISLLPKEFALLEFLMRYPGEVFSLEALLNRVWPSESDSSPDTVRVHLAHLRSKLQKNGRLMIKTVYAKGYKLEPDD